ncbi:MAG: trypsin-like peptidase domain-containing protein [Rhizobiales bacterium]|nr:trypsin-like peptidase domain-containing protein [Hyphomicrobiales bacterium]
MLAILYAPGLATARESGLVTSVQSVVSILPEWPPDASRVEEPEGSGVVVLDGYYIVTALHVIQSALSVNIRTSTGLIVEAEIVGGDQATDLALLKIESALAPLPFVENIRLGDDVCAIGNAFGLGISVACGIVSGVNRAGVGFNPIEDFIQTDAAVNPGASGGALVTEDGQLVGILSAIFTKQSDANIGVNFAVSAQLAARVVNELHSSGRVRWMASGLRLAQNLEPGETGQLGARVARVRIGSPADDAGIEIDDVVIQADQRRIRKPADFVSAFALLVPPAELSIRLIRGAEKMTVVIRLLP